MLVWGREDAAGGRGRGELTCCEGMVGKRGMGWGRRE